MGIDPSSLSRILRGLRPASDDFEDRVIDTIHKLKAANCAAETARQQVLAGKGKLGDPQRKMKLRKE